MIRIFKLYLLPILTTMAKKTCVVFGGTGLIGSALRKIMPSWIYLGSKDCDLVNFPSVVETFKKYKPDEVIFLAANVGGLYKNMAQNYSIYMDNQKMQMNIIEVCNLFGVKNAIFCLSTCIYPSKVKYPIKEDYLHNGAPHDSNYGYSYAKRNMEIMCRMSNETFGSNFKCIVPTNIYGESDNFSIANGHVLPALIHKAYNVSIGEEDILEIRGSGNALRQFIYSGDVAKLICKILRLKRANTFILAPTDEYLIKDLVSLIGDEFGIHPDKIKYTYETDGQYKKTVSNEKLLKLVPSFEFTKLDTGVRNTIRWFKKNYETART